MPEDRQRPRRVTALADHLVKLLRKLDKALNDLGIGSIDLTGDIRVEPSVVSGV